MIFVSKSEGVLRSLGDPITKQLVSNLMVYDVCECGVYENELAECIASLCLLFVHLDFDFALRKILAGQQMAAL